MDFGEVLVPGVTNVIKKLGWSTYVQTPQPAVASVMMEFYANVPESALGKTMVRGKEVKFNGNN